jgi:hypothetical protein
MNLPPFVTVIDAFEMENAGADKHPETSDLFAVVRP